MPPPRAKKKQRWLESFAYNAGFLTGASGVGQVGHAGRGELACDIPFCDMLQYAMHQQSCQQPTDIFDYFEYGAVIKKRQVEFTTCRRQDQFLMEFQRLSTYLRISERLTSFRI